MIAFLFRPLCSIPSGVSFDIVVVVVVVVVVVDLQVVPSFFFNVFLLSDSCRQL